MENYSSDSYVNNGLENVAMPTGSNDAALMTSLLSQALARMKVDVAPPSSPLKTVQRRSLDSPLIAARATSDGTLTPVSPPSPPTAARQGMCWAEFQAHLKAEYPAVKQHTCDATVRPRSLRKVYKLRPLE